MHKEEFQTLPYIRKHRPEGLNEYEGNKRAVQAIMRNLKTSNPAQTILLKGEPGCGKTSLARIIAKEYVCENRDEARGSCGMCINCQEIEQYILSGKTDDLTVDSFITEVNVALDRGVKAVESIIEQASYQTLGGEWQVRIFDEFQMASPAAQSAMLKIIEEPPEKTLWIFCTTNPEDINTALVTRFQLKLDIRKPNIDELTNILRGVCKKEGLDYDNRALSIICARNNFITRDALNTLERVANEHNKVTYETVLEVLQELADGIMFDFYDRLINREILEYVRVIHEIKKKVDIGQFVDNLISFTNRGIFILNDSDVDGLSEQEMKSYKKLFSKFTVQQICVLLEKLLDIKDKVGAETKLLLLGYSGLEDIHPSLTQANSQPTLRGVSFDEELGLERKQSLKSASEKTEVSEEESEDFINSLTREASPDDILALFSATKVSE